MERGACFDTEAVEGGYNARAIGGDISTQGDHCDDLKIMVCEAVRCHFEDAAEPWVVGTHLDKDTAMIRATRQGRERTSWLEQT